MKEVNSSSICSLFLIMLLAILVVEQGTGVHITFPSLSGDIITAAENSEINIQFGLSTSKSDTDIIVSIAITIENETKMSEATTSLCGLFYNTNTSSFVPQQTLYCSASRGDDTAVFKRNVSRGDDKALLRWRTQIKPPVVRTLRLNVTYPPTITSLNFSPESETTTKTVEKGERLEVTCSWKNGNPPTAVRLLHGRQVITDIYDSSRTSLTYTMTPAACNHSGVFTCQSPGAEVNRSVTLLVQCPPEFNSTENNRNVSFTPSESVTLSYHVVSHTSDVTMCRLRHLQYLSHDVYRPNNTYRCSVTGQPPDLKLTLVMHNVSDGDKGEWHLELSNDRGNSSTKFSLHIQQNEPGGSDGTPTTKDGNVYIMATVGCGLFLICVAIIVVVFRLRRKGRTADTTLRHNVDSNKKKPLKPVLSEDMIINEVYESAGDYPTALGNESTELSENSEGEYVYAHTAKIVTWKEQNPSNTAAGNSGEGDNVYAKVQKGDRTTPSSQGDNLYAEVQKGDKNTPFRKEDNITAKDHLTGETECAYMSVDVPGAVGKEAKGGDGHAS